ncbi:PCYCGC motif-containing (lipo)protein [Cohnella sp.]|uniref:PCYCGC motif-containing (lipo)protein n=1 Tax=Cohnella sp. TaxID=1883426 RepID=UPI003569C9F6
MKKLAVAALGLGLLVMSACGKAEQASSGEGHPHASHASNGDLREITASSDTLPFFLEEQPDAVRLAYQIAGALDDTLQWIPCYCGCGGSAGHKSNLNCFIHEVREDGTVEWDDHGTRCGVCVQIAVESAQLKQQGKSNLDIRKHIDSKYQTGYAKPTDTPMPAA